MNRAMRRLHNFRIRMLGGEYATSMTCREANCPHYADGWCMVLDVSQAKHAEAATWIKDKSGRRFFELRSDDALEEANKLQARGVLTVSESFRSILLHTPPGMVVFIFPPGETCFKEHLDREVVFKHNDYVHTRPIDFNEDMNIEGDKLNRMVQRG